MFYYRKVVHEDHGDIVDMCKDLWDGCDYLPDIFHDWVEDKGCFLGAVDTENNQVVGVAKYSILSDRSGWLEGLRVHPLYRGKKIARELSERLILIAKDELAQNKIDKIAFGTHVTNIESRTLMEKMDFKVEQDFILVSKDYEDLDPTLTLEDFDCKEWDTTYEEFANHPYFKRRNNILPLAFVFEEPTIEVYQYLRSIGGLISVNGYKGIYKFKGEPNYISMEDSFEAINTIANYVLLTLKNQNAPEPLTCIMKEDIEVINKLKQAKFNSWTEWKPDYYYYVYR